MEPKFANDQQAAVLVDAALYARPDDPELRNALLALRDELRETRQYVDHNMFAAGVGTDEEEMALIERMDVIASLERAIGAHLLGEDR